MKVVLIKEAIDKLKAQLNSQKYGFEHAFKYHNLKHFKESWDLEALDLRTMYAGAFKSEVSERLWGGSRNSAKSSMLSLIETQKEFVRVMFKDLFDESKDLNMRVNRFIFHCDQIRDEINKGKELLTDHYHNFQMASLYLTFQYPEKYTIIESSAYDAFLEAVECKNIPLEVEFERQTKLARGIFKLMQNDQELVELYEKYILKDVGLSFSMIAVHDLYMNTFQ